MTYTGEEIHPESNVPPNESLYRGIIKDWVVFDKRMNAYRPSSVAFKDGCGTLSVDIGSRTNPQESKQRLPLSVALASFLAEVALGLKCQVVADPQKGNPAHALVLSDGRPISKSGRKLLAKKCSWAIPPPSQDCH